MNPSNPNLTRPIHNPQRKGPVWSGPEKDGITYSMLCKWLNCRERMRVLTVEGLQPADEFNHKQVYGQMFHKCEESTAAGVPKVRRWESDLMEYARELCNQYPFQQEQIDHWYHVCKVQYPVYLDYWSKHPDNEHRTPLLAEQVFDVPYRLPSGRTVRLRGRWDAAKVGGGVYLVENKTKGDVRIEQINRQLTYDLQIMMYLVALQNQMPGDRNVRQLRGVRYNVVRRPLSGGKGTIVRHKPTKSNPEGESKDAYYARLRGIIGDSPEEYFWRWKVEVSSLDVERFRRESLDPILEQLCLWWEVVSAKDCEGKPSWSWSSQAEMDDGYNGIHYRHPFNVYNSLNEGGTHPLDEYLSSGSTAGLQQVKDLFRELQ